MSYIANVLEEYTVLHSNFETSRNYISMSHAASTLEEIVNDFKKGFQDTPQIRLRCYKGYQVERDMMQRINACFPNQVTDGGELVAFDGRVKGHPDFTFEGYPADIKSLPSEEHLPFVNEGKKISRKIFWQMQAYMLYARKEKALLIYEARDTGRIMDYWVKEQRSIQHEIDKKFSAAIAQLQPAVAP